MLEFLSSPPFLSNPQSPATTPLQTNISPRPPLSLSPSLPLSRSFATLGVPCPLLFALIDSLAPTLVPKASPQHMSNMAWAAATLDCPCPQLFSEIEKRSKFLVESGSDQAVSNTAWAFAKLSIPSPALFSSIDSVCSSRLFLAASSGRLNSQAITNTAWAFAKLSHPSPLLSSSIEKHAPLLVSTGTPHGSSNLGWAMAEAGERPMRLARALEDGAGRLVRGDEVASVSRSLLNFLSFR